MVTGGQIWVGTSLDFLNAASKFQHMPTSDLNSVRLIPLCGLRRWIASTINQACQIPHMEKEMGCVRHHQRFKQIKIISLISVRTNRTTHAGLIKRNAKKHYQNLIFRFNIGNYLRPYLKSTLGLTTHTKEFDIIVICLYERMLVMHSADTKECARCTFSTLSLFVVIGDSYFLSFYVTRQYLIK